MKPRSALSLLALLAPIALACADGRANELPADLEQDLQTAGASDLEMAPNGGQRIDVAAELLTDRGKSPSVKTVSKTTRSAARTPDRIAPVTAAAETPRPQPDTARTSDVAVAPDTVPDTRRPTIQQPARRGPYKSVGEIIRNAPFPINP